MALTKKDKDPTRAERKSIKRKLEEAIPDLPGDVHAGDSRDPSTPPKEGRGKSSKKRKLGESSTYDVEFQQDGEKELQQSKNKEKRKGKRAVKDSELHTDEMVKSNHKASDSDHIGESRSRKMVSINGTLDRKVEVSTHSAAPINEDPPAKKSKKERKAERKAAEAAASNNSAPPTIEGSSIANGEEAPSGKSKKNSRNRKKRNGGNGNDVSQKAEGKAPRFIIFIGNLPFSTTTESIQKHFAAVHPKSIRHLTRKDEPEISKGCAFLEFVGYDHMKACLKSFHHSMFDDGISAPRKINVELTVGGGGNKQNRNTKIYEKNQKLNEQRIRRMNEEEKAKLAKKDLAIYHGDIHPSRRARVPDNS